MVPSIAENEAAGTSAQKLRWSIGLVGGYTLVVVGLWGIFGVSNGFNGETGLIYPSDIASWMERLFLWRSAAQVYVRILSFGLRFGGRGRGARQLRALPTRLRCALGPALHSHLFDRAKAYAGSPSAGDPRRAIRRLARRRWGAELDRAAQPVRFYISDAVELLFASGCDGQPAHDHGHTMGDRVSFRRIYVAMEL